MKRKKLGLTSLLVTAALYCTTSCDTREDWFKEEGEGATFVFQTGSRSDTLDLSGVRHIDYDLRLVRFEGSWAYSDTIDLNVIGYTNRVNLPSRVGNFTSVNSEGVMVKCHQNPDGDLNLYYAQGYINTYFFDSDTSAAVLGNTRLRVVLKDVFDNEYNCYVQVRVLGDCPPVPVLEVKAVDGKPMERTFSMKGSYDKDGSVVKYEYCFDGNTVNYRAGDNRFDFIEGKWQSGKAAYGGTYITATAIDEVNHAFQETGEHTVCYRCMDNLGAWSTWKKQSITINE